jgi:hypothetical protein
MIENKETDADGVNPVTADELRDVMRRVSYSFMVTKRSAEVQAILEDALGFDDFTAKMRDPIDLNDAEREEAFSKLNGTLQGLFVRGGTLQEADESLQARIRKSNAERAGEAVKGRPTVLLAADQLPRALAKFERLLLMEAKTIRNVQDRIFQRDGKLVRLSRNLLPPGVELDDEYRENNALLIKEVKPKWLATRLERTIQFIGASAGKPGADGKPKMVPKNASTELCERMLQDDTRWRHPYLFGTIEAPTLRRDGTVLDSPGYDKKTGLFFDPGETVFPPVPPRITRDDGLTAIKHIEELLCDFPFQDAPGYEGVSLSVALAAILTGPVRRTLDIAPAFAVTAKEAETGKTELCKFIAGITTGRAVSGQPFSDSEEERRKSIGGNLRSGRPILFFDNADNVVIEGDFLEKIITLPSVTDRILSMTEEYSAPTNCLVLFNGNHISVGGAMTTRVLQTRIVTDTPLAQRSFQYPDLFQYVIDHRPELVWCVLVALRAWLINGEPDETRATSRFQQWDSLIAQALVWYGYADPMRGGDELRDVDPVKEAKREVVRQWAMKFGDSTVSALDLQRSAEVRQAIAAARGRHEREVTPMMVAKYVGTVEGVRLGLDWRVIRAAMTAEKSAQWRLEYVGQGDAPPLAPTADDESSAVRDFAPGDNDEDA